MGVTPESSPIPAVVDWGIPAPKKEAPKAITPEEANNLFGPNLAVKMNFVPQMIIAVALDYVTQFVNHCREKRVREFKKHNRLIKVCVEEYTERMKQSYGNAFESYVSYVERYFDYTITDRFKMMCSIGNVVNRQIKESKDRDAAFLIAAIHHLIDFAELYDRRMDKLIAEKINAPVRRKQDNMLAVIVAMCIEFEETWGFKLNPDPIIEANVNVLANRAATLADLIVDEETNVSKS